VVLREQLAALCERLGVSRAGAERLLARSDAIVAEIREHGTVPRDVPPDLAALYPPYAGRFLQSLFRSSPAEVAARLTGPVLVIQGEKDLQVSAERDAPVLVAALKNRAGKPRSDLVLVNGASHNLKHVAKDGEHAFFGPIVPFAARSISGWLTQTLAQPPPAPDSRALPDDRQKKTATGRVTGRCFD
jgi:pimeloyl-ACP methyl ester carboxylesterase